MRDPSTIQAEIIRVASERGLDPNRLSPSDYKAIQLVVTTAAEKAEGAGKALRAAVDVRVMGVSVSDETFTANKAVCDTNVCGYHRVFDDGSDACDACTCNGSQLNDKRRSTKQFCPKVNPKTNARYWDNRVVVARTRVMEISDDAFRDSKPSS